MQKCAVLTFLPAPLCSRVSNLPSTFRRKFLCLSVAADLPSLVTGLYSAGQFLCFRLGWLRNAVSRGIASEDFLKGTECGFVLVALAWHCKSCGDMPSIYLFAATFTRPQNSDWGLMLRLSPVTFQRHLVHCSRLANPFLFFFRFQLSINNHYLRMASSMWLLNGKIPFSQADLFETNMAPYSFLNALGSGDLSLLIRNSLFPFWSLPESL